MELFRRIGNVYVFMTEENTMCTLIIMELHTKMPKMLNDSMAAFISFLFSCKNAMINYLI